MVHGNILESGVADIKLTDKYEITLWTLFPFPVFSEVEVDSWVNLYSGEQETTADRKSVV